MSQQGCIFAQELIHLILGYLYDDFGTLKSCARVHSTWLPTARLHLFRTILLHHRTPYGLSRVYDRLESCMGKNTSLAPLVRHLSIYRCTNVMASLLDKVQFTHLRTLTLERMSWVRVPKATVPLVAEVLGLPSLVEVSFREHLFANEVQFATLFEKCRGGVETLHLVEVAFLGLFNMGVVGDGSIVRPQALPHTLSLIGGSAKHVTQWLLHPRSSVDVSTARVLTYGGRKSKSSRDLLLQAIGESVEILEIIYSPYDNTVMVDIGPNILPNLRGLTITGVALNDPGPLMILFSRLSSASQLEVITIKISCDGRTQEEDGTPSTWGDVDKFLGCLNLPCLKTISVVVETHPSCREKDKEAIRECFKNHLEIMQSGGLLKIVI